MISDPDVMAKIKKLLALSHSSNPHEAAGALKRAQKLLSQHGMTMDDIELSDIGELQAKFPTLMRAGRIYSYVSAIVAMAIGVEYVLLKGRSGFTHAIFIGSHDQLELADYVFTVLCRQLATVKSNYEQGLSATFRHDRRIRAELEDDFRNKPEVRAHFATFERYFNACLRKSVRTQTNAYLKGWVSTVYTRIEQMTATPHNREAIDRYMADKFPELASTQERRSRYSPTQMMAYQQGRADGQRGATLFSGVSGSEQGKKLPRPSS